MITFPSQSKITTNSWRDNVNYNVDSSKQTENSDKGGQIKKEINHNNNKKNYCENNTTSAFKQAKHHPKIKLLPYLFIGVSQLIIGYILHSLSIGSYSVTDFLYFVFKPQYSISEGVSEGGSRDLLVTMLFWAGVTIFNVNILINALPLKIIDSVPGAVLISLLLLLPIILLWGLWPFDIVFKIGWTLLFFMLLRCLYYWAV